MFIFATEANVTSEHLDIIARQENLPFIHTKILIVDEHDNVRLAPHLLKDFAIIDEDLPTQAIGIESSVDLSSIGARWVFRPDPTIERTAQWMSQMSITLEELKTRLANRNEI